MRGEAQHDKCISRHERAHRDLILGAVRSKIFKDRIPSSSISLSGRPMNSRYRERILRGEFEQISLRRAYLIADAVGVAVKVEVAA